MCSHTDLVFNFSKYFCLRILVYAHHKQYPGECVSSGRCSGAVQMVSEYYCVVIYDSEKILAQINQSLYVYAMKFHWYMHMCNMLLLVVCLDIITVCKQT